MRSFWQRRERKKVTEIITAAITSLVVSVIYCKISAAHTLKVIDGYVKSMIDMAKESIKDAYLRK